MDNPFVVACLDAYKSMIELALPVALFIAGCNIGINCIVSAFMGGRLHLGGK